MSEARGLTSRINFNTIVALGCILLGVTIWLLIPTQVDEPPAFFGQSSSGISPKLFPRIAAIGFMGIGVLYLVASFRMTERSTFRELPASAWLNVGVVLAVMVVYVTLLRPIGYVASSVLVAVTITLYYGSRNPVGILAVGIVAPASIYYLFTRWLSVSLPPFPWG